MTIGFYFILPSITNGYGRLIGPLFCVASGPGFRYSLLSVFSTQLPCGVLIGGKVDQQETNGTTSFYGP